MEDMLKQGLCMDRKVVKEIKYYKRMSETKAQAAQVSEFGHTQGNGRAGNHGNN